jgi:hypothetical protein
MWHAQNGEAMNMDKNITPNVVLDQSEFESERSDISTGPLFYIYFYTCKYKDLYLSEFEFKRTDIRNG